MERSEILPDSESGTTGEKHSGCLWKRIHEEMERERERERERMLRMWEMEEGLLRHQEWLERKKRFGKAFAIRYGKASASHSIVFPSIIREEYPRQVLDFFQENILNPSSGIALYLWGPSGSGKSHCINVVISRLGEELKNHNIHPPDVVSIDIFHLHQPTDMYKEVLGSQYHTREQFYQCLDGENGEKMRILIVENLDRCVDNNWQDLLEEILCLTNKSFLLVGLGRNMLDVEFTDVISFPSYGGDELTKIVRQTIEGMEISFKPEAVVFLTDKLQLNHGYLRVLESICATAMEKTKGKEVELDDIRRSCDTIEGALKNISRKTKPIHSQLLYKTVVTVLYEKRSNVVSLNDLQKTYQRMCKEAKTKPLTYDQIRAMCSRYNSNGGMMVHKDHVHAGPFVLETITTGLQALFE